jgi:2-polyprenyl-6-methoxyphenol hydroxylase-like FAD-dependent oxidoreductase
MSSTRRDLKVVVIGAGVAGLATALALKRQGAGVVVYEQAECPGPIGAGVLLNEPGLLALAEFGLRKDVERLGKQVYRLQGSSVTGKLLLDLDLASINASSLGVHRGALFQVLYEACHQAGVEICLGKSVSALSDIDNKRNLTVIADGSASQLRSVLTGQGGNEYKWGALWAAVPAPYWPFPDVLKQVYSGAKKLIGFLPTGQADLVTVFWSVRLDMAEAAKTSLDWIEEAVRMAPFAEGLLRSLNSSDFVVARYRHAWAKVSRELTDMGIVFIGDALHSMSPQLGQGANLALQEASCLARSVSDGDPIWTAQAALRDRARYYSRLSRLLSPWFQSDTPGVGAIRDSVAPLLGSIPAVRREMLRTFAGLKTGWLS